MWDSWKKKKSIYDETWDIGGTWLSEQPEYEDDSNDFGSDTISGFLEKELYDCPHCIGGTVFSDDEDGSQKECDVCNGEGMLRG